VLFKQGLVGLALFGAIVAVMGRHAWAMLRRPTVGSDLIVASFVASLIAGITEEFWLDPGAALAVGVGWGLVVAGGRLAQRRNRDLAEEA